MRAPAVSRLPAAKPLDEALRALEAADVPALVLRDPEPEPEVRFLEVDLLVPKRARRRLRGALEPAGFAALRAWGHGSHLFFLAYSSSERAWLKLDVVTELPGADADAVLARRRIQAGLPRPAEGVEEALVLIHVLVDKGGRPGRHTERLRQAAARPPPPPPGFPARLGEQWADAWRAAARSGHGALEPLATPMRMALERRHAGLRARGARLARRAYYLRRAMRPAVPTLVVSGADTQRRSSFADRLVAEIGHPVTRVRQFREGGALEALRLRLGIERARRRHGLPVVVEASARSVRWLPGGATVDLDGPGHPSGPDLAAALWLLWARRLS